MGSINHKTYVKTFTYSNKRKYTLRTKETQISQCIRAFCLGALWIAKDTFLQIKMQERAG